MIVVDVETSGLNPNIHSLLSIGAIDFSNQMNTFYGELAPISNRSYTDEALKVNGIDIEEWKEKQYPTLVMTNFSNWLERIEDNTILAGHNPTFDLNFVQLYAGLCGVNMPFRHRTVDLHSIAYAQFGEGVGVVEKKLTSDRIYELLKMKHEPKPHNALNGAKWETEAFNRLILNDQFAGYDG